MEKSELEVLCMDTEPSTELLEEPDQPNVIASLQNQVSSLQSQLAEAEMRFRKSLFRLENVRADPKLNFTQGFQTMKL